MSRHAMKVRNKCGTKTPRPMPDVRVGDVWRSSDPRDSAPWLTVVEVTEERVRVTKHENVQGRWIKRSRMRPTSTGYKLVERDGKQVDEAVQSATLFDPVSAKSEGG